MEALLDQLHHHFNDPWIPALIKASLIIVGFTVLVAVSRKFFRPSIFRLILFFGGVPNDIIISAFLKLFRRILILIGLGLAISSLPLPAEIEIFIHNTIFLIVSFFILLGLFDLSNIIGLLVSQRAVEFEVLVNRVLKMLFAVIILMISMRHFNYDIWHIMTALGVGTLAVGLAAQPTLTNMIAGFTILIDRPFRRGDRISLSTGETGDVVNIGMRSTHILNTTGNMLVVSNSELVATRLVNYSFPNDKMIINVKFYTELNSDLDKIKNLLLKLTEATPRIVKGSVSALLSGINSWGAEVTVSFNVEHYTETSIVSDKVIIAAITEFRRQGIALATNPFPPTSKI
jgi:MscS family membrane protein